MVDLKELYKELNRQKWFCGLTDDDVQDLAIKLYPKLDEFDSNLASFQTWVATIAKNHVIAKNRLKTVHNNIVDIQINQEDFVDSNFIENIPCEQLNPIDDIINQENKEMLLKRLKTLSESDREIIIMWSEGESYEEIAIRTNFSIDNIKAKIFRIKERLKSNKESNKYFLTNVHTNKTIEYKTIKEIAASLNAPVQSIEYTIRKNTLYKKTYKITKR